MNCILISIMFHICIIFHNIDKINILLITLSIYSIILFFWKLTFLILIFICLFHSMRKLCHCCWCFYWEQYDYMVSIISFMEWDSAKDSWPLSTVHQKWWDCRMVSHSYVSAQVCLNKIFYFNVAVKCMLLSGFLFPK